MQDEEIKQALIKLIMRKLHNMGVEDLRQMYTKGCELCDKYKPKIDKR